METSNATNERAATEDEVKMCKRQEDWTQPNYDLRDIRIAVYYSSDVTSRPIQHIIHSQPYFHWRVFSHPITYEFNSKQVQSMMGAASVFTGGSSLYPVVERYGYVWAWYGNPDNAD